MESMMGEVDKPDTYTTLEKMLNDVADEVEKMLVVSKNVISDK